MAGRKKEVNGRWYTAYSDGRLGATCEPPTYAELVAWAKDDGRPPPPPPLTPPTAEEIASVILTTGDLPAAAYDVLDCVLAVGADETTGIIFRNPADASKAFESAKTRLRIACKAMGGDAVVHCQFQYRNALSVGDSQGILELFGYGTAVKIRR